MAIVARLKTSVNGILRRYGYRIERLTGYDTSTIDILRLLIDQLHPKDPGFFFVQVGAHDGQTDDPLRKHIMREHWRGLLLEPQPDVFRQLCDAYRDEPQLILENAALSWEDGERRMFTTPQRTYLASFDRSALSKRIRGRSEIIDIVVPTLTFETLVRRHGLGRCDLLVVDTEGFDYEVIKMVLGSLDSTTCTAPKLIYYEHLHLSTSDRRECAERLGEMGYGLMRHGTDTIALRQEDCQGAVS